MSTLRGRFAPTPSGPLHAGSLVAATASWLSVRARGGEWWLRIDDLDRSRCPPGAADHILRQLEAHGLHWDSTPRYQTQHCEAYAAALARLRADGRTYRCNCTRALLRQRLSAAGRTAYDGWCRQRPPRRAGASAERYALHGPLPPMIDAQGRPRPADPREVGDPVVWRVDAVPGYGLACALDEIAMGITEVLRGEDLLTEGYAQHRIIQDLGGTPPCYRHVAVRRDAQGRKLSKQNHAPALDTDPAACSTQLTAALDWLGLAPSPALRNAPPAVLLAEALSRLRTDGSPDVSLLA